MTDLNLNAIKARCDAATPGPWVHQVTTACFDVIQGGDRRSDSIHLAMMDTDGDGSPYNEPETYPNGDNDAEFIAHAREDVPALAAEVERLREALEQIATWDYRGHPHPSAEVARNALGEHR